MGCGKSSAAGVEEPSNKPSVVFVLGGPGSGKGTQCAKIVDEFKYEHLSTGDLLREEVKKGGELGDKLKETMEAGKLVSSGMLVELLKKAMKDRGWEKSKFLLDGFPRNQENIDEWEKQIGNEAHIKFILHIDVSKEVMKERLLKRGQESGRADDNEETIVKRFETFEKESLPIIKFYEKKKLVRKVDSSKPVDEVYSAVQKLFKA
ncbi:unnamed protein product [Moneuplotes crassus]|uniref:adenylate kinase n=1 Tax=Euplotes crassus TaxID=5936 RepID=A0AAD2D411_EUPCR|nr:unnamed protein product [Moneuplotes crassus]|mmetsp:Transcript_24114/g.24036  ORF Transcript_24114/g.24036 Transcript_24114/m.24036 type:complete len:206 (-) Transcript_24114:33-650(-)|eukprot:CAMPEP_0196999114 /NCGR_PEP_ID=MMETSP1380-20130617/4359_1 /TAXON_ID=5936 /ORGANISM="Euplotes crassus, Strain CT5" /LENGTH=205 /DNA_ID=CAMNT_0042415929 /DNA_START=11 /DNA_END=628 /DNA_ORIENTATION=+